MEILESHLPPNSFSLVKKWISQLSILVKIKKSRNSKLGDFRVNKKGEYLISINDDLNKFAFLITLTHEIAHAFVWEKYKRKVSPHGKQWKATFKELMLNFLNSDIFPDDILRVLSKHLKKPNRDGKYDCQWRKSTGIGEVSRSCSECCLGTDFSLNLGNCSLNWSENQP